LPDYGYSHTTKKHQASPLVKLCIDRTEIKKRYKAPKATQEKNQQKITM
jgi:hypothetical protein